MKIEKFENDKVKVTLTTDDLLKYDISSESVTPDSPKLHKFLFEIMESVREQTGFNPYSGQVVVEAVQDFGGITLFISKLRSVESDEKTTHKKIKSVKINKNIHKNRYVFTSFDCLCEVFKVLKSEEFKNCVLYSYEEKWFITVPSKNVRLNIVLKEYCDSFKENVSDLFFKEHAAKAFKDEKLLSMINGIKALD